MIITDIETNGLLDTVSKFHCAFIYDTQLEEYIGFRPEDFEAYLHCLMSSAENDELIVFHNGIKYDIPALEILAKQRGIDFKIPQENVLDTLVLARLIYSNIKESDMGRVRSGKITGKMIGSQSLETWGYRLGEMKGEYKYDFKKRLEEEGETYESGMEWLNFNEEMYDYCKQDVKVTYELTKKLLEHKWYNPTEKDGEWLLIDAHKFWESRIHAVKLEHEAAWLMAKQERNGFPFDKDSMIRVYTELAAKRTELLKELQETFGSWYRPKGGTDYFRHPVTGKELPKYPKVKYPKSGSLFLKPRNKAQREGKEPLERSKTPYIKDCPYTPVEHVTFNPSSREHIALKLQEAGWQPTEFTSNGTPIVNDEVLKTIKVDDTQKQKCIDLIATYLMVQKRIGQIAEGTQSWLNSVKEDSKIHGSINPNGAVTGRCTHSYPNLAQIPSVSMDKEGFIFGLEGGYGTECRMAFGAEHHEGWVQAGVDASGLELRCLGHFMSTYDNGEYIEEILNGDIHTKNQLAAGLPTRNNSKRFIYGFLKFTVLK